MHKIETTPV